jgi:RNA polymerase sigma-70 factor (ECF subfamily)
MNFESLWRDIADLLGAFIRARVSDGAAADDIRQDVFLKMHRRIGQLRDAGKIESWLFRIARNAITDHYRARRETTEVPETLPAEETESGTECAALRESVRRLVSELPDTYREAVLLAELEDLPLAEVAQRLGITLTNAKSRVRRGRAQLREMLLDCCRFSFDRRGGVAECEPRREKRCPECDCA